MHKRCDEKNQLVKPAKGSLLQKRGQKSCEARMLVRGKAYGQESDRSRLTSITSYILQHAMLTSAAQSGTESLFPD